MKFFIVAALLFLVTGCAELEKKPETCPVSALPEHNGVQYPKKSGTYKPVCYGAFIDGKCTGPEF